MLIRPVHNDYLIAKKQLLYAQHKTLISLIYNNTCSAAKNNNLTQQVKGQEPN